MNNRIKESYRINEQINVVILESKNDINGNTRYKYLVVYSKYLEESFSFSTEAFTFWGYGFNSSRDLRIMVMLEFAKIHNITGAGWRENWIIENCLHISEWLESDGKMYKFFTDRTDEKESCMYHTKRGWVN